ncbi:Putative i-11 aae, partial [Caligus rogercresseyi]
EIIGCKNALNSSACSITIGWIGGHDDNTGNEFADALAKDGARRGTPVSVLISLCQTKNAPRQASLRRWRTKWREMSS